MNKPKMLSEVAVVSVGKDHRVIVLDATADAITEFLEFGTIDKIQNRDNRYFLYVDARYNFDEVLTYAQTYGKGK